MTQRFFRRDLALILLLALIAHAVLLAPSPILLGGLAALLLTGVLPGYLLVEWLVGGNRHGPLDAWERSLYTAGAGACLIVMVMLLLSYLPGPITRVQTLLAFDGVILLLILALAWRGDAPGAVSDTVSDAVSDAGSDSVPDPAWLPVWQGVGRGWFIAGLLSLALVGGFMRLPNLGYSEFQGDETRALLRTAEAIQGYGDALMTHKKGPGEILLPGSLYVLVGQIHEAAARLPFTLLNLTGLFAIYLLGWRLFGPVAGWSAAMILALDGYFIGFGRIVQYQSMVFCLVVLTVLALYRLTRTQQGLVRYLTLAAIFLGTGLLAHYEAALATLPALYLLYRIWRGGVELGRLARAMIVPVLVGAAILVAFYVPFVLHPAFAVTYAYITVNRIGGEFPYNRLADFFERSALYSTTYYLLLMIALTVAGLIRIYRRNLPSLWAWIASALLVAGVALSFVRPSWLIVGGHDHTWAFFALTLAAAWFMPHFPPEERLVWLWFGAPMIFMLFFTLTPNTHVYGFIIAWSLVVGSVVEAGYRGLARRWGARPVRRLGLGLASILLLVFGNYATWYFVMTDLEVLRNWRTLRPAGYWVPYSMPTNMSIFGFPLTNGWKAIGVLYADGVLDAPFKLHGKEPVADWYTRGLGPCERDHVYYLWHESVEPMEQGYNTVVRQQIEEAGYQLFGEVTVNAAPRMAIYKMSSTPLTPQAFALEAYAERFDREFSGPIFEEDGPTAAPRVEHPLDFRFGESIQLLGYRLEGQDNTPGGGVWLTLYWQAVTPVALDYSVFTQVLDRSDNYKAGQRDGEPGCNLFPTSTWRPGVTVADRYYIELAEDARPGTYTLLIGMYDRETGERLDIFTPAGDLVGDALGIDEVRIAQP